MSEEGKIILLDCDGPLTAFDEQILALVRPGTTKEELEALKDWDVFLLLDEKQLKECHKILKDPKFWKHQIPRELSQKMVESARKEGNEIVFVTSPWEGCREWDITRREWLKKHFDAKGRDDVIITAKKDLVYGNAFIDDKPSNVLDWKKRWGPKGGYGLLYETHTNKFTDIYPRVVADIEKGDWRFIKNAKR